MNADAKVWWDHETESWEGIHDGACDNPNSHGHGGAYTLVDVLRGIELCMNKNFPMRWEFRVYPDGKAGLRGFVA